MPDSLGLTANQLAVLIAAVFAAAVIVGSVMLWRHDRRTSRLRAASWEPPLPPVEIARIEQTSDFTVVGAIAVALLVLFNITALFGYYSASTVLQQTVAVLGAISASAFWGVFVIIGRKHSYRVMRDPPSVERTESQP